MFNRKTVFLGIFFVAGLIFSISGGDEFLPFLVPVLLAHCDTEGGPVISAAKKALETGNVDIVLVWIRQEDEAEIKNAFEKTIAIRKLSYQAQEFADRYFFETLVRIHRAGEGESYTGIKLEGSEVEPGIAAADLALETGSVKKLERELTIQVSNELKSRFQKAMELKKHRNDSVESGRHYVAAYVSFIHFVEKLHLLLSESDHHNGH